MKQLLILSLISLSISSTTAFAEDLSTSDHDAIIQKMSKIFVDGMSDNFMNSFLQTHCEETAFSGAVSMKCMTKLNELKQSLLKLKETEPTLATDADVYLKRVDNIYKQFGIE